jgi:glycine/D-amino acid oxidase-like deaminating enzyme
VELLWWPATARLAMGIDYRTELPPTSDVVIVGGGIVGAATVFHAAAAGLRPLLLEKRPRLSTLTTAAAAGGYRLQVDDEEAFRLVAASVDLFERFEDATGQRDYDPRVRPQGYLWLTTSEEGADRQRRLAQMQRSWGLDDVEIVDGDTLRGAFGFVGPNVVQGRFRQRDGLIDPKAVALGLTAGSGAVVVTDCDVVGFDSKSGQVCGVRTSKGTVSTERVVIAAGPFSGVVAGLAGVDLPVQTVVRQKVVMPDVPEVPPGAPMTVDEDTGAHWRPAMEGAFLLFTDPSTLPSPPTEDLPIAQRFAFDLLDPASPVSVARVSPFWRTVWNRGGGHWSIQAGQYTMTPDRRPLIGETEVEGLFVNTGYCGHGVMQSPGASAGLAQLLAGSGEPPENPFRPDRTFESRQHLDRL